MTIFDGLNLFGGLAMFLYGMRLMGDGLKESSSGTLKKALEYVTNNQVKAFLLGLAITAIIQSSKATIVITSGLVAAGIISLRKSLGIIVGANVGTTVTGQIIRLLDIDSSVGGILKLFTPSTLAPLSLIIGMVLLMGFHFKNSKTVGSIAVGFGILFSGLLNMMGSVDVVAQTGVFESMLDSFGSNPFLGFLSGAVVAFILQSSSATVGVLQAFSSSGHLTFNAVYAVILGIFLGDCLTTGIMCSLGANSEAKQVGIVNIFFNLGKIALCFVLIFIMNMTGLLDTLWTSVMNSGNIADMNTVFNLISAVLLFPFLISFEKLSARFVKEEKPAQNDYQEKLEALNPVFFQTPALALRSCYDMLLTIFNVARTNVENALDIIYEYDEKTLESIRLEEENIDMMTDRTGNYLASLSATLKSESHANIMNQYYKMVTDFERLGDYAVNIADTAQLLHEKNISFSEEGLKELNVLRELLDRILDEAEESFKHRNVNAAYNIEPLEEVCDEMVDTLINNHIARLSNAEYNVESGTNYIDLLGDIERISDICSNVGLAIIARVNPSLGLQSHDYSHYLHSGADEDFNAKYKEAYQLYFDRLEKVSNQT